MGATTPAVTISDLGKKVQTKDVLEKGAYPVVDQGKVFIRGYCNDPDKVIHLTGPIVLFGDHTRETKLIDFDFVVGADGVKLLQPLHIDPFYYFLALRWLPLDSRGYGRHFKLLRAAVIPLPPIAEQKRIVAKVDELMALCDRLEAQQQERDTRHAALARASLARFAEAPTLANLDIIFHTSFAITPTDLRKSILTLAVQGKLAEGLETKRVVLGEVIELISGQHLLAHEHNEVGKGIPYLTGPSDFGLKHPSPTRWTETPKVVAEPGDILVTVKGSGVGKTNKLIAERTAISRQLMAVRVTGANPDFVHLVLMNAADHFQSSMTGIAIPGIGRRDVLELEVELPPLPEQQRIVDTVGRLMELVDQLETQLSVSRTAAEKLMEAVVAELTVQD